MTYTDNTRVLHVNNVAGVGPALVHYARSQGKHWAMKYLPAGRGRAAEVVRSRLRDFIDFQQIRKHADLVDIHFATNGYYAFGGTPTVLHLHGTDIRKDRQHPLTGHLVEYALNRADAVICATPDLLPWVHGSRPDAQWLPNPVPTSFFPTTPPRPGKPGRVILSSRWDDTKGVDVLLPLISELRRRNCDVHTLDWGPHAAAAAKQGATLHPLMDPVDFAQFLASASVVVGQLEFPALSMTDYQTLALGVPLVGAASLEDAPIVAVRCENSPSQERARNSGYLAEGEYASGAHTSGAHTSGASVDLAATAGRPSRSDSGRQLIERCPQAIAEAVEELAATSGPDAAAHRRAWVEITHHPRAAVATLEEVYARVLHR